MTSSLTGRVAHNQEAPNILGVDIRILATRVLRARLVNEIHPRKVLGYPTLQTVVRWSICRDLSCKRSLSALRSRRGDKAIMLLAIYAWLCQGCTLESQPQCLLSNARISLRRNCIRFRSKAGDAKCTSLTVFKVSAGRLHDRRAAAI